MLFAGSSAELRTLRASPNIQHTVYLSKFHKIYSKSLFTPEMSAKNMSLLETAPHKLERFVFQISSSLGEMGAGFCSLQHRF